MRSLSTSTTALRENFFTKAFETEDLPAPAGPVIKQTNLFSINSLYQFLTQSVHKNTYVKK